MNKTHLCEGEVPGMEDSGPGPGVEAYLMKQKLCHIDCQPRINLKGKSSYMHRSRGEVGEGELQILALDSLPPSPLISPANKL